MINPLHSQQLPMRPLLQNPPRSKHKNNISILNRSKPMRNSNNSPPTTLRRLLNSLLNLSFTLRV